MIPLAPLPPSFCVHSLTIRLSPNPLSELRTKGEEEKEEQAGQTAAAEEGKGDKVVEKNMEGENPMGRGKGSIPIRHPRSVWEHCRLRQNRMEGRLYEKRICKKRRSKSSGGH